MLSIRRDRESAHDLLFVKSFNIGELNVANTLCASIGDE